MTKRDLHSKISLAREYLRIAEGFGKYSRSKLLREMELKLALERALYLAVQSAIDLAESYISIKGYRRPSSMHEVFHILHERKVINATLAEHMLQMVGFRNILAHGYSKLDYEIVLDVLKKRLNDIKRLIACLEK